MLTQNIVKLLITQESILSSNVSKQVSKFVSILFISASAIIGLLIFLSGNWIATAVAAAGDPTCWTTIDGVTVYSDTTASPVQTAVNIAADNDLIKVAGTCIGVNAQGGVSQTVYITKSISIQGGYTNTNWAATPNPDTYPSILDADGNGRVVYIPDTGAYDVVLSDLQITNGVISPTAGGGIGIVGVNNSLLISNTQVYSNYTGDVGGAIWAHEAQVTFQNSAAEQNSAQYAGGGLYLSGNEGTLTVTGSFIYSNTGGLGTDGAGIHNDNSTVIIRNSTIQDNFSGRQGGGFSNSGTNSQAFIENTLFKNNEASTFGGAIYNRGELTLDNSVLINNQAVNNGGAIHTSGNDDGSLIMSNSTIASNYATNGIGGFSHATGDAHVVNSTISNNGNWGISSWAGAQNLHITNTSIISNEYGLQQTSGLITISHSVIDSYPGSDCNGTITSMGYNSASDNSCSSFSNTGDINNTEPVMGDLAANGGANVGWQNEQPMLTHALLVGTPLVDAIPDGDCLVETDQRGVTRPFGIGCDIGAVEAEGLAPFARDDMYEGRYNQTLIVPANGVLENDVPDTGITPTVLSAPSGGFLNLNTDGSFSYTPILNEAGPITYTYIITSDGITDTATVTMTFTPIPPTANDDTYQGSLNETLTIPADGVLTNDSFIDTVTPTVYSPPADGSLNLNSDGSFSYTPSVDETGPITYTYVITQDDIANSATVTMTFSPDQCFTYLSSNSQEYGSPDARAIQEALIDAQADDLIKVAGTCSHFADNSENDTLVTINQNVTLQGGYTNTNWTAVSNPSLYPTTLDAAEQSRVVEITSTTATLDGLILTGGYVTYTTDINDGGGLLILGNSDVTLSNNLITHNYAIDDGGGIYIDDSSVVSIENCQIISNTSTDEGGGMRVYSGTVTIENSDILENFADDDGGGINIAVGGTVTITQSHIDKNIADDDGGGIETTGNLWLLNSTLNENLADDKGAMDNDNYGELLVTIIDSSVISGNIAADGGGNIDNDSIMHINNSVIQNNRVEDGDGGGVDNDEILYITNTQIIGNYAFDGGGGINNERGILTATNIIVKPESVM